MKTMEAGDTIRLKEKTKKKNQNVIVPYLVEDVGLNFVRLVKLDDYLRPTQHRALLSKQTIEKMRVA